MYMYSTTVQNPSTHLIFIHPSIQHLCIHPFNIHASTNPFNIYLSTYSISICPSIHPHVYSFNNSPKPIHLSDIYLLTHHPPFNVYLYIHSYIHTSIHPTHPSKIHTFIHPSIHLLMKTSNGPQLNTCSSTDPR